jgi:hypothetical protein
MQPLYAKSRFRLQVGLRASVADHSVSRNHPNANGEFDVMNVACRDRLDVFIAVRLCSSEFKSAPSELERQFACC